MAPEKALPKPLRESKVPLPKREDVSPGVTMELDMPTPRDLGRGGVVVILLLLSIWDDVII